MRLKQLDILRAVAVLLVLGRHMPMPPEEGWGWLRAVMVPLQRCGWIGVDLFFVLSGFLIAGLLFREHQQYGQISLKRFYIRRGFKIYPPFYVLLLATVFFRPLTGGKLWPRAAAVESVFLQNYSYGLWGHTWSLAVEEHFYIALPILLVVLLRRTRPGGGDPFRSLAKVCVAVGTALLCIRFANALWRPYTHRTHLFPTHLRIDSLMFGVLLSYFYHAQPMRLYGYVQRRVKWILAGSLMCIIPSLLLNTEHVFMHTIGLTLLYLGFGGILLVTLYAKPSRWGVLRKAGSALAFMGCYSYSIYLWHIPIRAWGVYAIEHLLKISMSYPMEFCFYVIGGVSGGIVLAKVVEIPFLAMRDRLFPSRSRPMKETPIPLTPPTPGNAPQQDPWGRDPDQEQTETPRKLAA